MVKKKTMKKRLEIKITMVFPNSGESAYFFSWMKKLKNHQPCTQKFLEQFRGNIVLFPSLKITLKTEKNIY